MKRMLGILLALMLVLPFAGCVREPKKIESTEDDLLWFCPYSQIGDSPAKAINIATGEVLVACPDPLCDHSASSETCFFNFVHDRTRMRDSEYVGGHIFFEAERTTEDGVVMKLYDYDADAASIDEVYTFDYIDSSTQMYHSGRRLFFTAITEEDENESLNNIIGLFEYDVDKKSVTLLDGSARYALYPTDVVFYEDHYIRSAGHDQQTGRLRYCKCSYDGSEEEYFDSLPDGTTFGAFGWQQKPCGYFINTEPGGGIYLWDENRRLDFPNEGAVTSPRVYRDSFYYTTRSAEIEELGVDPVTKRQALGYRYDNEVYVLNKDGSYRHYTVESDYHFIIQAAYENVIIGSIQYRIRPDGCCIQNSNSCDYIRIDLSTGETTLYDTTRRSGFAVKTYVTEVRLNEN